MDNKKAHQLSNKIVIAITAGKGGVGKSNVALNLSVSLAKQNKKVYLLDADFGLSNIDILLGVKPKFTIEHVLNNQCSIQDILIKGPFGLNIISGSSGIMSLAQMDPIEYSGIIQSFDMFKDCLDILVIDTPPGISEAVVRFSTASQEVIIVLCNEPTSLADAYSLIKVLHKNYSTHRFKIVVNMTTSQAEAEIVFNKLLRVAEKHLNVLLQFLGWIPYDEYIKKSIRTQKSVVEAYPSSQAAIAFEKLAQDILATIHAPVDKGQTQFLLSSIISP